MLLAHIFKYLTYQLFAPGVLLRETYEAFKKALESDKAGLELIAELEDAYHTGRAVDLAWVHERCVRLSHGVKNGVDNLIKMSPLRHLSLQDYFKKIDFYVTLSLTPLEFDFSPPFVIPLDELPRDSERLAGGKASRLARIARELSVPVPRGFVATSRAFNYFCEYNNLRPDIDDLLARVDITLPGQIDNLSLKLQTLIENATVPPELESALRDGLRRAGMQTGVHHGLAVRSSAVGEDSELTFAGQYKTLLGTAAENVTAAYKLIIASKYSASALVYRITNGLIDLETPMAVLFLEMVDPECSGVVYTSAPENTEASGVSIYSLWGLGEPLVAGEASPDVTLLSRVPPCRVVGRKRGTYREKAVPRKGGGVVRTDLSDSEKQHHSLSDADAVRLAESSLGIESFYHAPQDVEWCKNRKGDLFILQARDLRIPPDGHRCNTQPATGAYEAVLRSGERAAGGAGGGRVFVYAPGSNLDKVPFGSVLVAQNASPDLARVAARMNAAVTERGSVAGHLASVAREAGIPLIVNAEKATQLLKTGEEVTVYADEAAVYRGIATDLIETCKKERRRDMTPFSRRFRSALNYISPLNLVDPAAPSFTPEDCRTMHDILRYVHEKAVHDMFVAAEKGAGSGRGVMRLDTGLPLAVYLLDLGGALREGAQPCSEVRLDDVVNPALGAVFAGMCQPGIEWPEDRRNLDWQALESTGNGAVVSLDSKALASYVLASSFYLNLNMRFGYHFAVVDVLCLPKSGSNHIMLRYKGGGAEYANRRRRVDFLSRILTAHGFETRVTGDLIDAALRQPAGGTLLEKMKIIGVLLGSTRMLDMVLVNDDAVAAQVQRFLTGDYRLNLSRRVVAEH
ncbi:MAG TPA: PEP/pyruvate-binding domain-containing protein [Nitrospirota bacterium]|nr:PEP/pyruvate-binding domain-containing protein [Nitrospirota bacterium]